VRSTLAHHPVVSVVTRRLLMSVPLLVVVTALSFLLISLTPGDAANTLLGTSATAQQYAAVRQQLGLNLPLYDQYWRWLHHAFVGNLGTSLLNGQSVSLEIWQRLPTTLSLVVGALVLSTIVGVAFGVFSAVRGGLPARAVDAFALVGIALPAFWVGLELVVVFSVSLGWFPATGFTSLSQSPIEWLRSLVLPVLALSLWGIAALTKQTREAMADELTSQHIWAARANGIGRRSIIYRHALKNASVRIVTTIGTLAVGLLLGTVFVETVFALPGVGSLVDTAVTGHDLPVVQGAALVITLMVVIINLVVDILYTVLNPRISVQ
jgi:peptide/nickel transport system permease protein